MKKKLGKNEGYRKKVRKFNEKSIYNIKMHIIRKLIFTKKLYFANVV